MKQCHDIDELMVDYLYQELEGTEGEAFRAHVESCARCSAELKSLQQMRQALHSLPEVEPSAAVTSRLLHEAGKRARSEETSGPFAWFTKLLGPVMAHPAWAAAATLLIVAGVAGTLTMRHSVSERTQPIDTASAPAAAAETPPAVAAPAAEPAPAAPDPATTVTADKRADLRDETERANAAPKPAVRSMEKPEAPKDYVNKVPAPAITAAPKAKMAKPQEPPDHYGNDVKPLDEGYRGGRISSDRESTLLKEGKSAEDKQHAELDRRKAATAPAPMPEQDEAPAEQKTATGRFEPAKNEEPPASDDRARDSAGSEGEAKADRPAPAKPSGGPALAQPAPQRPPMTYATTPPANSAGAGQAASPAAVAPASPPPPPPAPAGKKGEESQQKAVAQEKLRASSSTAQNGQLAGDADGQAPATESSTRQQVQNRKQPPEPPEMTLLREAQKSASTGNCGDALALSRRIQKMNSEFHRKRVAGDASLRACMLESQKKAAPARTKQAAPADALEAPDTTTKESAK